MTFVKNFTWPFGTFEPESEHAESLTLVDDDDCRSWFMTEPFSRGSLLWLRFATSVIVDSNKRTFEDD
jgi:hypothetical protein